MTHSIPVCDRFYDGSPENKTLLARSIQANPEAQFIKFKYNPQTTFNLWSGWQILARIFGLGPKKTRIETGPS